MKMTTFDSIFQERKYESAYTFVFPPNKFGEVWAYVVYAFNHDTACSRLNNCDGNMQAAQAIQHGGFVLSPKEYEFMYHADLDDNILAFKRID